MTEEILSIGIDIGTSTTQMVFSKIVIKNMASAFNIARIEIVSKTIIYRSAIYFTPLIGDSRIDMQEALKIVDQEFAAAGIDKKDVRIGAVIITGETARRDNANEVLHALSGYAGDFVVATAGVDLESILSGKGAGADTYSKENNTTVANIDIGGGTSNIAIYHQGDTLAASCMDIGGRLIKIDKERKIYYISKKIHTIIEQENLNIKLGEYVDEAAIRKLCSIMADTLAELLKLKAKGKYYDLFITAKDLPEHRPISCISFSGGVADVYYHQQQETDLYKYGDIGIILAQEMHKSQHLQKANIIVAQETIRATVVGAGAHTADISGSTIEYDGSLLPLKNIPVVKVPYYPQMSEQEFSAEIRKRMEWFRVNEEFQNVAIAFDGINSPSFRQVEQCANAIVSALDGIIDNDHPLIILVEADMAKALGFSIRSIFKDKQPVICIDSVHTSDGDYIDIGKPVANGVVLPVVIKTLIFQ